MSARARTPEAGASLEPERAERATRNHPLPPDRNQSSGTPMPRANSGAQAAAVTVSLNLLGREVRIGCAEAERADLLAAAELLQEHLRQVREASKSAAPDRIAVLAALNLANELVKARSAAPETSFDSNAFRRRILGMQDAIENSLAGQEKLF